LVLSQNRLCVTSAFSEKEAFAAVDYPACYLWRKFAAAGLTQS